MDEVQFEPIERFIVNFARQLNDKQLDRRRKNQSIKWFMIKTYLKKYETYDSCRQRVL